ncbi:excinuclease ABC subunit A [Amylibacter sp. SFDW26]|uniref:excinuclease ABC subunit A n=1 Tax=Amylibacter sp. SFDW26 TaxID=2652722 RepID=UPI00126162CB|nr:excinuclease ABC subunit A [Amylibacter sp. SFDW26]KAB7613334.1 excinuclease ABC subunit A [Amylibacter sp. SFDW26]
MSHSSSIFYLKLASEILIGFGTLFFFALFTPVSVLAEFFADLVFLPLDGLQTFNNPESKILIAIMSGISIGWGIMIYMITNTVYTNDPKLGGQIILTAVLTWFIIDSTASVLVGAWFNAVLNTGFLAIFITPILLRKETVAA